MKRRLLDLIQCHVCGGTFRLEVFSASTEIEEGRLICESCQGVYPIINGIPRLLPDQLAHVVVEYHPEFFKRYAPQMSSFVGRSQRRSPDSWWRATRRTSRGYSYQWRKFKAMLPHWERVFLDSIRPIEPAFFKGRLGLDAGCGFGRSLYYAASYGAEVIGMDLSEAVESARENTRGFPHVHLIQADIFHPPLPDRSLDFMYSIGVLHILPDPKGGFLRLRRLLRSGAPIFIWLYSRGRGRQIAFVEVMRGLARYLPYRVLDLLCLICAAIQWVCWIWPYQLLSRFRATQGLARRLPFTYHANYPFRVLYTDWFDGLSPPLQRYYRREEVEEWFHAGGLERITMDPEWGRAGGGGRGLGYAPAEELVEQAAR